MPKRKFEASNAKSPAKGAASDSESSKPAGKSRFGKKGGKDKDAPTLPVKQAKTKQVKAKDFFGAGDMDDNMGFPSVDVDLFMDEEEPSDAASSSSSSSSSGSTEDYDEKLAKEASEKAADKKKRSGGFQSMSTCALCNVIWNQFVCG
jgi:hypothetical protein